MQARSMPHQGETNMLGDALADSRLQFRQLVTTIDRLIEQNRKDDALRQLAKLEILGHELHRLLNPRDEVESRNREQIDREVKRLRKALRKGWSGTVGTGLVALILGLAIGITVLAGIFYMWFIR